MNPSRVTIIVLVSLLAGTWFGLLSKADGASWFGAAKEGILISIAVATLALAFAASGDSS